MLVTCKCPKCGKSGKADITITKGAAENLVQPIPVICPKCADKPVTYKIRDMAELDA